jgi:hypothetical protein
VSLVGRGRNRSWPNLGYYPGICLYGLRKTTKNLSQVRQSVGRDLNPGPPEYVAGVLTTQLRCSVGVLLEIKNFYFGVYKDHYILYATKFIIVH